MSRTDRLDESALRVLIESLENDLRELRSRQSVPNSLVSKGFFIAGNPSDYDVKNLAIPANTRQYIYILFTGDGSQLKPYGYPIFSVFDGTTQLSDRQVRDANGASYAWGINHSISNALSFFLEIDTTGTPITASANIDLITSSPGAFSVVIG